MEYEASSGRFTPLPTGSVGDIALKLPPFNPVCWNGMPSQPIANLPPGVVDAMNRLVDLVTELRRSAKDWLKEEAPTPKVLLPYVLDEAQDVWAALRDSQPQGMQVFLAKGEALIEQDYVWLKTLTSWLLWTIARCSHDSMRLLEGQAAQVALPQQVWQTGVLRLVPVLAIHTPLFSCCIDLATDQLVPESLPTDRLIQMKGDFCHQPTLVAKFIAHLTQEMQHTTPAIVPFIQGMALKLLIPGFSWQDGSIQLDLAFEFVPTPHTSLPTPHASTLKFTAPDWRQAYTQAVSQHYWQSGFSQFACFKERLSDSETNVETNNLETNSEATLSLLVATAYQISDRLCQSWTIASRQIANQPWTMEQFAARLMWCLMHSAYLVMQIMTGIEATVLQPQATLCTGILQFAVALKVQTPEADWEWNGTTGQLTLPDPTDENRSLSPDALIQIHALKDYHQPVLLKDLEQAIWQTIEQSVPELLLLVQGAEISLQMADMEWQPAIVRLQGQMRLTPVNTH